MKEDIYVKDRTLFICKDATSIVVSSVDITIISVNYYTHINFSDIEPFREISFTGEYSSISIETAIKEIAFVNADVSLIHVIKNDNFAFAMCINLINAHITCVSSPQNDISINSDSISIIDSIEGSNVYLSTRNTFIGQLKCKSLCLYDDVYIGILYSYVANSFEFSLYDVNVKLYNHPNIIGKNYIILNVSTVVAFDDVKAMNDIDNNVLSYAMSMSL